MSRVKRQSGAVRQHIPTAKVDESVGLDFQLVALKRPLSGKGLNRKEKALWVFTQNIFFPDVTSICLK
jgi:hypothetical protein